MDTIGKNELPLKVATSQHRNQPVEVCWAFDEAPSGRLPGEVFLAVVEEGPRGRAAYAGKVNPSAGFGTPWSASG